MRLFPTRLQHGESATLVDHLGELRHRLFISLLAIAVGFSVAYAFRDRIIHWLNRPLAHGFKPITLNPVEPFTTSFMISLYAGILLATPVVLWQFWGFFAPAFHERTQRLVLALVAFGTVLAAGGLLFGYYVALPAAIHFLTNYDSNLYNIQLRARDYYSFVTLVLIAVIVVFEVPIVILGLVRMRVLTADRLRRNRRLGYVIMFAIAVALPGVDPVTTTLEAIPLLVLFEGSIWLSVLLERRMARAEAENAETMVLETRPEPAPAPVSVPSVDDL
jgi:sec-independent protein translocase protein TatC